MKSITAQQAILVNWYYWYRSTYVTFFPYLFPCTYVDTHTQNTLKKINSYVVYISSVITYHARSIWHCYFLIKLRVGIFHDESLTCRWQFICNKIREWSIDDLFLHNASYRRITCCLYFWIRYLDDFYCDGLQIENWLHSFRDIYACVILEFINNF